MGGPFKLVILTVMLQPIVAGKEVRREPDFAVAVKIGKSVECVSFFVIDFFLAVMRFFVLRCCITALCFISLPLSLTWINRDD
jgi:hypothetical protein